MDKRLEEYARLRKEIFEAIDSKQFNLEWTNDEELILDNYNALVATLKPYEFMYEKMLNAPENAEERSEFYMNAYKEYQTEAEEYIDSKLELLTNLCKAIGIETKEKWSVEKWLIGIDPRLKRVVQKFKDEGFEHKEALEELTDDDLKELGLEKMGHRLCILDAIKKL